MELIQLTILISALLCSLVAGLVLCFAIIVMPGIKALGTFEFLQSFKAMDRVIQNNQPRFLLVWIGSGLAIIFATLLGIWHLEGLDLSILIFACIIYILGVHLPTITINIPINNRLQSLDLDTNTPAELQALAELFETRWLRWNNIRTGVATFTSVLMLVLLIRL